jgi:HEAT repeat protein
MADLNLQLKAIEALVRTRRAINNIKPYPPVDSTIMDFIEMLYIHLMDTLRQDAPLAVAELEKKALSHDNISNQQGDETIPASSLFDILLALDVKSISSDKDLEKEELHVFINLLAKKPRPVQDESVLHELTVEESTARIEPDNKEYMPLEREEESIPVPDIAGNATAHVEPDNKEYMPLEREQKIVLEPEIAEDQISESVSELEKVFARMNALDGAVSAMPSESKMAEIGNLSMQVAQWVEKEEDCTLEYKELCRRLETLLQEFISNGFYAEAIPIINAFSRINSGLLKKNDQIRDISIKILKNMASENNFNILFKEINTNNNNKKYDACQVFAGFGSIVINKLLDGLKKASDSKARISIIHIIEEMGPVSIPAIKASIDMNAQWYYLRNMAYILGRIGNEKNIEILKPLLMHKENRVRKEAFKSICQTGGSIRGSLFLSVLPQVDKDLRISIIEMLGKIKCTEAVTDLQFMLKSKYSTMAKNDQISLQEEICNALGSIGSTEAIKILSEIAESKSILGIGSYSKEVKYAAERALTYIKRR